MDRDEPAGFTDFQRQAMAAIDSRWKGSKACPICETSEWTIGFMGAIPSNRREAGESGIDFSSVFPTMPVICVNCGYTMLFNTISAGIVPPEDVEVADSTEVPEQ